MNPSCNLRFFSSTTTVTFSLHNNDHIISTETEKMEIPSKIDDAAAAAAATKIQAFYRAHIIRTLYKKISSVDSEAHQLQRQIQLQETVDAIRSNEREKLRMNEALMSLLLKLDSVPGIDPAVRDARRKVSHKIVGLQEIVDAICGGGGNYGSDEWWCGTGDWDETMAEMEQQICKERGGEEMERFCAEYLGFRCLQRFLHEP